MAKEQATSATVQGSKIDQLAVSIGKNTLFGVVAKGSQGLTRLVTIPVVIVHLGLAGYGIWAVIMSAAAYMRFGSVGTKSAFQKYVAEATGTGDYERASALLSTGAMCVLILSLAGLIPVALFSRQLAEMAGVPPEFLISAAHAISVLALIMVLSNAGAAFEAIVMGGHRIDIARKFTTMFTAVEALAIILVLHKGYGLFAMATIMGVSEVGFVFCCFWASRQVVPQIHIARRFIRRDVLSELMRYAGSFQLVNLGEVACRTILPIAVLRVFGADTTALYALADRLQTSALMPADAFLAPILSGASKVFNSGSRQEGERLLRKSFKIAFALMLLPLGFIAVFGTRIIYAWTGQVNPAFRGTLYWVCLAAFFSSSSLLALVLYRASGRALLDNIRQLVRLVGLLAIAMCSAKLGFEGSLSGVAAIELAGLVLMLFAIHWAFPDFRAGSLLPSTMKLTLTTAATIGAGILASQIPLPVIDSERAFETIRLCIVCVASATALVPALAVTRSITNNEIRLFLHIFSLQRFLPVRSSISQGTEAGRL